MDAQKTGMFIQNLRKEKNMTQVELAEKIHVSDKAVSRWETGKGFPDINSFEDIAAALDTSVSELLSGERFEEYVKPGCECIDTGMKKERERAEQAFLLAEQEKPCWSFLLAMLVCTVWLRLSMRWP